VTTDTHRFAWTSYDLRSTLQGNWQESIRMFAESAVRATMISPTSVTSRESVSSVEIPTHFVDGARIVSDLTWLHELYTGLFRDLAQEFCGDEVATARDPRHGMLLHVRRGTEPRYECHVDSAPVTGLFYATDHPVGTGGELVVANRRDVRGPDEVEVDATRIHPVAGQLIFFDGRNNTHFIAPLNDPEDLRISLAMTFFTASHPEETRPADLDDHLGLN
jgi:hypothetical protein